MIYKPLALLFGLFLLQCQTAPMKRQTDNSQSENRQLATTVHLLNTILHLEQNYFPWEDCDNFEDIRNTSTHKTLCYMYDQYVTYRNQAIPSNSGARQYIPRNRLNSTCQWDQTSYSNITAKEYIALKSMSKTCQWAQQKHTNAFSDCSLCEIQQKCAWYRHCEHEDLRGSVDDLVQWALPALSLADRRWILMPNVADLLDLNSVIPSFRQEVCELMPRALVCEA